MKKIFALVLATLMLLSLTACMKSEEAKLIDEQIAAIGEVTLESGDVIASAEATVEALAEEIKKELDNLEKLEEARATYDALVLAAEEEQAEKDANEVEALINEIGEITLETTAVVDKAQDAYDALSDKAQAKVENYSKLVTAENAAKEIKKVYGEQLLNSFRKEEDKVRGMSFYYPDTLRFYSNGSWAADIRCFMLPYIGKTSTDIWLRLLINYTDDDWVFFEKITVAADDERFYKSFSYNDIVRDNGGGDVWEYVDINPSDYDIEMLWAIVNSEETIIRFEGDEYRHDSTVTAADKAAIKEILEAYEALN